MAKIVKYDQDGNEVFFDHAIDARQAVESGQFFHTNPTAKKEKAEETELRGEKADKKNNKVKTPKDEIDTEE